LYDFTAEQGSEAQSVTSHSRYADFFTESFLLLLKPKIEEATGEDLLPTYSYYRVYKQGDKIEPHVDRDACEVSVTLTFGWPNCPSWPFKIANDKVYRNDTKECHTIYENDGIIISLESRDALVYIGTEVKHWRDPLPNYRHVQVFLHYVRASGSYSALKFDKRTQIGEPQITSHFEYIKYSNFMKELLSHVSTQTDNTPIKKEGNI